MAAPVDWLSDFVTYLALATGSGGHGAGTLGTNLFRFQYPAAFNPDNLCTVVTPIGGPGFNPGLGIDFPAVQILHRCRTADTAWEESQRLYHRLKDCEPVRLGSDPYTGINGIKALQAPFSLGQDEARAWVFVASYELDLVAE